MNRDLGAGSTPTRPLHRRWHRLIVLASFALVAAGAFVVARSIAEHWSSARPLLVGADPRWLVAAAVTAATGMTLIGLSWRSATQLLGFDLGRRRTLRMYFQGEMAKYVPGGIWAVVGRAELARRLGTPAPAAYGSVVLSLMALYLSCGFAAALAQPVLGSFTVAIVWRLAIVPIGLLALHPRALRALSRLLERLGAAPLPVPRWRQSIALVLRYLPAWAFIGLASWCLARALVPNAPLGPLVAATSLAWLTGFLALPAPAGIGVREVTFVVAAASAVPAEVATAVAVLARLTFMLVDALAASLLCFLPPSGAQRRPASTAAAGEPR